VGEGTAKTAKGDTALTGDQLGFEEG